MPAWTKSYTADELDALSDTEHKLAEEARRHRGVVTYDPYWLVIRLTDSKVWFTLQVLADFLTEFKVACADRLVDRYAEELGVGAVSCPPGRTG